MEPPVEGRASKGVQELAELMRQGSLQTQQDHLQQADQYPFSASHQRYKQHVVPALLEDDLTELTASSWVQHSLQHHSSHSMHHSSGVIFAPLAAHSHAGSSAGSREGSSNTDSRHLGFFQDVKHPDAAAATPARPSTAGPALHAAQQQHPTGAVSDSSSSSRAKADLLQQQQQKTWLQFQHVPQSSSDEVAALTRSRSSPEPAVRAYTLLQQDLSLALPQDSNSTKRSDKSQQGPPADSTTVRAPAHIAAREQLTSSSPQQLQQRQQGTWHDLSPAGPEYGISKAAALARRSLPGDIWCTSDEAQLLLQKNPQQASAGGLGQPLQQHHSWGGYSPDLPVDRPASTPPGFLVNGQQFRIATPQPSLPQLMGSPRAPAALQGGLMDVPAGSLFYGGEIRPRASWPGVLPNQPVSPTSRTPVPLSPEAAAAAATAASSIQQALAAVEEELQQLRVLQELNKQRRMLQANARVAVAQAAAAAAASVAGQTYRLGVLPTAGLHGRLGSVGSSGSSVVNSGSSASGSGFSNGSLGDPAAAGWLGAGQQSYSQNDQQSLLGGNAAQGGMGPAAQSSSSGQRVVNAGAGMNSFADASPSVAAPGVLSGGFGWSLQSLPHAQRQQPVLPGHHRSSSSSSAAVSAPNQQLLADDLNSELHQLAGDAQQLFQLEQILHALRQA